jgi:hypothetical protein
MSYSPNLLKNLGTKLAMEFIKEKRPPEIRLFQAILLQAFEDSLSVSNFKKECYWKQDSHEWFMSDCNDFQEICWNAEMDPQMVREEYIKLMKEGKIIFTKNQRSWINYRNYYKAYRNAKTKEERDLVRKTIFSDKVRK